MSFALPQSAEVALALVRPYAPYGAAAAVCLIVGIGIGLVRIGATAGVTDQAERWALPEPAQPKTTPVPVEPIIAGFWSERPREPKQKAAPVTAKPVSPWRLVGFTDQDGEGQYAVIEVQGAKLQRLKLGDVLPDGSPITNVSETELSFAKDGVTQTVRLFVEKKAE